MSTLPLGFDTVELLESTAAGRCYAAARYYTDENGALPYDRTEAAEVITGDHPECYILKFADDSIIAVSNADDEVWADFRDYLSQYELDSLEAAVTMDA